MNISSMLKLLAALAICSSAMVFADEGKDESGQGKKQKHQDSLEYRDNRDEGQNRHGYTRDYRDNRDEGQNRHGYTRDYRDNRDEGQDRDDD